MKAAPLLNAFEDEEIGRARRDLDVGCAHDGTAIKVGSDLCVMHLGEGGHLLRLAPAASTRANSYLVVRRSPVAIGMRVPRATMAICSGISGGTGSSNHNGS